MKNLSSSLLRLFAGLVVALVVASVSTEARADKLRDIAEVSGARDNQLVGFGVVTGLAGTGDDSSAPIAAKATIEMLRRLGISVDPAQVKLKNVAAVVVTATLPPFAKSGTKLDITVSSIGNAKSLAGGTLVQSLLKGADQKTYAVAQGALIVGSGKDKQSTTTAARIPGGALVEREVPTSISSGGEISLSLRSPSFSTATNLVRAIDQSIGEGSAHAKDGGSVIVKIPAKFKDDTVGLIAKLEDIEVATVKKARVVINEKTGTIVAGGDVRLAPAAIVHGGLTIVVKDPAAPRPAAAPAPAAAAKGKGAKGKQSAAAAAAPAAPAPAAAPGVGGEGAPVRYLKGAASLSDVAAALGTLGLSARDLASVLSTLRTAGALEAEVVIE